MPGETLIAQLPPMRAKDYETFERTVPVFGAQRAIRRRQLQVVGVGALLGAAVGPVVAKLRGNTIYVVVFATIPFGLAGMAAGHVLGRELFPSVACNRETRFVRRLWWANQCAQTW
eukprot:TRINITY_DN3293_c0_g1_i1.p4 TRINITY_DN3293_c0_g1~~TRINITY_DN3293_c0_g1_i1.p4  ORF type:complete len:123 (-),score=41.76 TRINITY_DN3293_c0_g1_i1:160-507(-)